MQNLYWQTSAGKTINLVNTPFESEEKLEAFMYAHPGTKKSRLRCIA
jgi:hypothetical protein